MSVRLLSVSPDRSPSPVLVKLVCPVVLATLACLVGLLIYLQQDLDRRSDRVTGKIEELAQLPRGEVLRPALLGYQHLGADILWLRTLQVLGKKKNSTDEHAWLYHAMDVITTLDPRYAYVYYVGGVALTDMASRADLSNQLLEKGHAANPNEWNLPFLLGYNHYFVFGDPAKGAEYIGRAAKISGAPGFLPGLATRMYAESGNPDVALQFLEAMWRENPDIAVREKLEVRAKEIMIERDLRRLEEAIQRYHQAQRKSPRTLSDLVLSGILQAIPEEPFGGAYQLDSETGRVSSSSRPVRLKVFRSNKQNGV
jgi:tetratricopeptide (TPR) repeat protein